MPGTHGLLCLLAQSCPTIIDPMVCNPPEIVSVGIVRLPGLTDGPDLSFSFP